MTTIMICKKNKFKKLIQIHLLLLAVILLLSSCIPDVKILNVETIITDVVITKSYTAKYSQVEGSFLYKNKRYTGTNGVDGYYYREYNLKVNEVITIPVVITTYDVNGKIKMEYHLIIK